MFFKFQDHFVISILSSVSKTRMLMRQDVNNEVGRDLSIKMIVTSLFLQVRYNDLAYYQHENITDPNGPAMTHSMFTIGWLEAGEQEQAERAFIKNFANIQGPFKVRNSFPLFFFSLTNQTSRKGNKSDFSKVGPSSAKRVIST